MRLTTTTRFADTTELDAARAEATQAEERATELRSQLDTASDTITSLDSEVAAVSSDLEIKAAATLCSAPMRRCATRG